MQNRTYVRPSKRRAGQASPPEPPYVSAGGRSASADSSGSLGRLPRKTAKMGGASPQSSEVIPAARRSVQARAEKQERERLEQEAKAAAALHKKLAPFNGCCWWCLKADHDPADCEAKAKPDMSDFTSQRPAKTRSRKAPPKAQTTRSVVEQVAYRQRFKAAHKERSRALETAAKEYALALIAKRTAPLVGWGALGLFTLMQVLTIEFVLEFVQHLTAEQLQKDAASIDRAALQRFTKLVKAVPEGSSSPPYRGLNDLRIAEYDKVFKGDAETSFYLLYLRCAHDLHHDFACELVAFHRVTARCCHPHCAEVQALPISATLLAILQTAAAKPPRGRPVKGQAASPDAAPAGFYEAADNWADGGYTPESMAARTAFDTRRINVSLKMTQEDVLAGSALIFKGIM